MKHGYDIADIPSFSSHSMIRTGPSNRPFDIPWCIPGSFCLTFGLSSSKAMSSGGRKMVDCVVPTLATMGIHNQDVSASYLYVLESKRYAHAIDK
jgi:hypothetical protein